MEPIISLQDMLICMTIFHFFFQSVSFEKEIHMMIALS